MMDYILIFVTKPETRFWGTMILLFILGLAYVANKLTRGKTANYIYYEMNASVKKTLIFIHGFGSLILALLLPNNYLNEIDFIERLYEENQLWIAGTVVVLLFAFIILFGTTFTFIGKLAGLRKLNNERLAKLEVETNQNLK